MGVEQTLMGGGVVELEKVLVGLLELQRCACQRELVIIQAPLNIEMTLHEIHVAFALGTGNRLMVHA